MAFKRVSEAVIKRLPRYYRHLVMLESQGVERISSEKLAQQMRLNASQVRQDFNCFGGFGQQGYGYNVRSLLSEIKSILALDRDHSVVIVGAGNIGHALTNFEGFAAAGFKVLALFDVNPELVGKEINGKPVFDCAELEAKQIGLDRHPFCSGDSFADEFLSLHQSKQCAPYCLYRKQRTHAR